MSHIENFERNLWGMGGYNMTFFLNSYFHYVNIGTIPRFNTGKNGIFGLIHSISGFRYTPLNTYIFFNPENQMAKCNTKFMVSSEILGGGGGGAEAM